MDLSNVPEHAKAGLVAMNAGKVLAEIQTSVVLERHEAGESIAQIASDLGITGPAVYKWLIRNAESGWREQQAAQALHRHDEAEEELRNAQDGVTVSRARELARLQQWKLERVLRRIYGQDAPSINIQVNLGDIGQRIQDLERELLNAAPLQSKSLDCDNESGL